jgi:hypothetical protein
MRLRWTGHVTRVVGIRSVFLYSRENVKGRDHLEDVCIGSGTVYCKGYKMKGVLRS